MVAYISAKDFKIANICKGVMAVFPKREAELNIKMDKSYTRQQMISLIREASPEYSSGSCQWKLGEMLKSGEIVKTGYNQYMISTGKISPAYLPDYSKLLK